MRISGRILWKIAAMFFIGVTAAWAYPPDNAAVLYYKAMARYDAKDAMGHLMADFARGQRDPNDMIRRYVKNNRVINTVLDACRIKNCDWGLDYSEGFELALPHLYPMRKFSELLLADARLLAMDGNYEEALSRCMSSYRIARHVNDKVLVCYLVGNAIHRQTNDCVIWIMSQVPQDVQILTLLKSRLVEIDSMPFSIKPAILGEREMMLTTLSPDKTMDYIWHIIKDSVADAKDESFEKKIKAFDKAMLERSREYFEDYFDGVTAAFGLPCTEGYAAIAGLTQKVKEDAKTRPEAILTNALAPAYGKVLTYVTRLETQNNAIKTAIEICLIKAKTGKLPDTVIAGPGGDLFSGKPFVYEKTADGFILRCQGEDLDTGEIYKYEFRAK